jgi:hypothetical protein
VPSLNHPNKRKSGACWGPRLRDSDLFPTLPSTPRLHRKIRKRALVGMEKRSVVRAEFSAAAEEKLPSRAKWRILKCAGESVSQKTLNTAEVVIDGLNYAAPTALERHHMDVTGK